MTLQRYVQGRQSNNHFCGLVSDELVLPLTHISCKRDFARFSLTYRYFSGKCSDKIHSIVHSVQIFEVKTIHAMYTRLNHPHFFRIPMITWQFNSDSFLSRVAALCNRLPRGSTNDPYNLKLSKSNISPYLFYISSDFDSPMFIKELHSVTL